MGQARSLVANSAANSVTDLFANAVATVPVRLAVNLVAGLASLVCVQAAIADTSGNLPSPEQMVRNMSAALQTLNYEGNFVHVREGNIESMHILHSSDNEGELERMLSLNGEAREVFRNRSLVTCIWPDSNAVIVSDSKTRKLLPNVDAALTNAEVYDVTLASPDRVAGIATHVVHINSRDEYRYGYRLWIDQETSMLLRSTLVDQNGDAVEQVMFVNIEYPENIDANRFTLPSAHRSDSSLQPVERPFTPLPSKDRVTFESLPMGYKEVSESYRPMPINDGPVSHLLVSDGMASASVYVEYVSAADQQLDGLGSSSMGGMNAFMHSLPTALVTVVGEVPPATVEAIAHAVRLVE